MSMDGIERWVQPDADGEESNKSDLFSSLKSRYDRDGCTINEAKSDPLPEYHRFGEAKAI